MPLIQLVLALVLIGVILYLVGMLPIDPMILTIIRVVVAVVVLLWIIEGLGLLNVGPVIRFH